MEAQQEYWAALKLKYEEKNAALQQREFELRQRLEALQSVMCPPPCADPPCPNPCEERPGFFKCLASLFRASPPSCRPCPPVCPPPPPPVVCPTIEIPTKENKETDTNSLAKSRKKPPQDPYVCPQGLSPYIEMAKNENCQCSPCIVDMIPPETISNNGSFLTQETCACNQGDITSERRSVRSGGEKSPCDEVIQKSPIGSFNESSSSLESSPFAIKCKCCPDLTVVGKCVEPTPQPPKPAPEDNPSLKSIDIYNLQHIQAMATQQKNLQKQIAELEQKNQIYQDVLREFKSDCNEPQLCPCSEAQKPPKEDPKTNAELKLENFLLKNELKEMRMEVRQYLEKMEGPMMFKIESERFKCYQLEQKLEQAAKELADTQEFYQKEINGLKLQLCTMNSNNYNLNALNDKLNQDLKICQETCAKLEDDLMRAKISEGETLRKYQRLLEAQKNMTVPVQSECSLNEIARELSKVLKECEPCGDCMSLPEDLRIAAKLLKSLTDLVNDKLPRKDVDVVCSGVKEFASIEPPVVKPPPKKVEDIGVFEITVTEEIARNDAGEISGGVHIEAAMLEAAVKEIAPVQPKNLPIEMAATTEARRGSIKAEPDPAPLATGEVLSQKSGKSGGGSRKDETTSQKSGKSGGGSRKDETASQKSGGCKKIEEERASPGKCICVSERKPKEEIRPRSALEELCKPPTPSQKEKPAGRPCKCKDDRQKPEKSEKKCKCKRKGEPDETSPLPQEPTKKSKSCRKKKEIEEIYKAPCSPPVPDKSCFKCGRRKKSPTCLIKSQPSEEFVPAAALAVAEPKFPVDTDDSLHDRFKLLHQVTASKSKDILKSTTSVKALKTKENFPFDVDTKVDVIDRPPDGVHVTTTVTKSGTLEVVTEGPEGVIETTLVYTNSGNINVVTEIVDQTRKTCNIGRIKATPPCDPNVCVTPKQPVLALPPPPQSTEEGKQPQESEDVKNPNCQCVPCEGGTPSVSQAPPPTPSPTPESVSIQKVIKCQCAVCDDDARPKSGAPSGEIAKAPLDADKVVKSLSLEMHADTAEGPIEISTTLEDSGSKPAEDPVEN